MSSPQENTHQRVVEVPVSNPFEGHREPSKEGSAMSLLALSHTLLEHHLYRAMLAETTGRERRIGAFGVRVLMRLTGLRSYSSIRRGCVGLINKLSIDVAGSDELRPRVFYLVYTPEEIFARRRAAGIVPYPEEVRACEENAAFAQAVERIVRRHDLSRREALVILCCAEGLSNAGIGERLGISEQTVKSHLRHIFVKFGVKRRAELVSRLLAQNGSSPQRAD
jgi:DNA-binding CsgD family transcriptional regulator